MLGESLHRDVVVGKRAFVAGQQHLDVGLVEDVSDHYVWFVVPNGFYVRQEASYVVVRVGVLNHSAPHEVTICQ